MSTNTDQIFLAADHAGFSCKERLKKNLAEFHFTDLGTFDEARVDYPDYADRVAVLVRELGCRGILICGSGQGMAIRANRYPGIRAALVWSAEVARLAREHNNANIICLPGRFLNQEHCADFVRIFLTTGFSGGRHFDRVRKLDRSACSFVP